MAGLGFGKVNIVAAVHNSMGASLTDFMESFRAACKDKPLIIASEYVYIADNYAQINNLYPYRIIMTYGATESLIPEDCDMIIENTETGNTLRKNNLKIIDTLDVLGANESEGCLIASEKSMGESWKKHIIESFVKLLT
jgi:ATP phosphoribosyltransferase